MIDFLEEFFSKADVEAYLVGGAVRDVMLSRQVHDVDVAVDADPARVARDLAGVLNATVVPIGQAHGLARLLERGPYRKIVDITHISQTIEQDLARRDFTIDAMALPLGRGVGIDRGVVVDPFNGVGDLARGLVKVTGPGVLGDDPLRLLRAVRLSAQLGFSIEEATSELIRSSAHLLSVVAPERVRDELMKILAQPGSSGHLRLMDDLGLLALVVPELEVGRGIQQPREHYWDVFNHSIETPGALERVLQEPHLRETDPVLRLVPWHLSLTGYFQEEAADGFTRLALLKLTCLLHDVAKPQTKTIDENRRMRFFGHSEEGAKISRAVLRRMRYSGRSVSMVSRMIEQHLRPSQMNQPGELPTKRALYKYFRDLKEVAIDLLYLNLADYLAARGPNLDLQDWEGHCRVIESILLARLEQEDKQVVYKLVSGHDIMHTFGLSSGPLIGELVEIAKEAQAAGQISTKEEALELLKASLESKEIDA